MCTLIPPHSSPFICLVILGLIMFDSVIATSNQASRITARFVARPGWEVVHADFGRSIRSLPVRGICAGRGKGSGFGVELRRWAPVTYALAAFLVPGTTRGKLENGIGFSEAWFGAFSQEGVNIEMREVAISRSEDLNPRVRTRPRYTVLTWVFWEGVGVVKAYCTREGIVLPIIENHHEEFPPSRPLPQSHTQPQSILNQPTPPHRNQNRNRLLKSATQRVIGLALTYLAFFDSFEISCSITYAFLS